MRKNHGYRGRASTLHDDIVAYAKQATPTAAEHGECERVIHIIRKACYDVFKHNVQVTPFGSYANGLATRASDVDLVITGLMKPDTPEGFFGYSQMLVAQALQSLQNHLLNLEELGVKEMQVIGHTRVPLLKVTTASGIMLDISINDNSCCKAAHFILEKVRQHPPVRPICLVLKDFLREYGLSEVKDGGLGGYALTNMVIAHVLELLKAGFPTHDFGNVLLSFLDHYGNAFDSETQAVCVRRGGIVGRQWVGGEAAPYKRNGGYRNGQRHHKRRSSPSYGEKWFIENPVTGLNVAQGSYNMHWVRERFASGHYAIVSSARSKKRTRLLTLLFSLQY